MKSKQINFTISYSRQAYHYYHVHFVQYNTLTVRIDFTGPVRRHHGQQR